MRVNVDLEKNWDYSDYSTIEIGQNIERIPRKVRRIASTKGIIISHLKIIYTIHLSWCFGMGRQWCFLWDHGGFRVFQHQTPSPKLPSWHRSNSNSHPGSQPTHPHKEKTKKMTTEKALYIILQQPITAKLYWWLLKLFFKNREATLLCFFFATMGSLFGYLFIPVCIPSFPPPFFKLIFT